MANWNPWHGCHKKSEGCLHCYVYRMDEKYGRDSSVVQKTAGFDLPVRRDKKGRYKIPGGELVYTCFSSDFLVEDADAWREEAWDMMRCRNDLEFLLITKCIERLAAVAPPDWGGGWPHVTICATMENQARADERLPIYLQASVSRRIVICEPLLGPIHFGDRLGPWITRVVAGGESGPQARPCDFEWVRALRRQCDEKGVEFYFKQTGANFIKDGKHYRVPRREQHAQARKAGISTAWRERSSDEREPQTDPGRGPGD